jgi:hypothetical protein
MPTIALMAAQHLHLSCFAMQTLCQLFSVLALLLRTECCTICPAPPKKRKEKVHQQIRLSRKKLLKIKSNSARIALLLGDDLQPSRQSAVLERSSKES